MGGLLVSQQHKWVKQPGQEALFQRDSDSDEDSDHEEEEYDPEAHLIHLCEQDTYMLCNDEVDHYIEHYEQEANIKRQRVRGEWARMHCPCLN